MKQLLILCFIPVSIALQAQTLLCQRDEVSVYYVLNQSKKGKKAGEWNIYFDIKVDSRDVLVYKVKVRDINPPFVPPYLIITVLNAEGTYAGKPFYIHGIPPTIQASTDSTATYKVKPKRFNKHMVTKTVNGEEPRLTGEFIAELKPEI